VYSESHIDVTIPPSGHTCVECDRDGGWWVHLRRCTTCGHIGCCDDSLSKHATAHWRQSGHPSVQTFEPGEIWFWDYDAEEYFDGPELRPPTSYSPPQTSPGPAERLPVDWVELLDQARAAE
jgi:hypothetical protein